MKKYVLRRALIAIPTFFGITVLVFLISSMASGSPLELLLNNQNISAAEVERQRIKLGLDQPLYIQYFTWIKNFFQGNLGDSYRTGQPVMQMILEGLGPTILLTFAAVIIACLISIPLGVQSARYQNKGWDNGSSVFSFLATSTPSFFLAVFLYVFSVKLKVLPIGGMYDVGKKETIGSLLRHLFMPSVVLAMQLVGSLIQYTRSSMLEVMREDFVRTARSKGIKEKKVIIKHVLLKFFDTGGYISWYGNTAADWRSSCHGAGFFLAGNRKPDDQVHRCQRLSGCYGDYSVGRNCGAGI